MKIVFVDAGNYCRSPAAEAVMRRMVADAGLADRIQVGSGGLKDKHVGDTADPRSRDALAARGYDLGDFRCREISAEDWRTADLVLAMDGENLAQLEQRRPADAKAKLGLFLDAAGGGEVPDPYFGGEEGFADMMDLIERGARALLEQAR
ncbi:MAG TPA: low molecular weight protein-tyrosine-phosphatase [Alphaproteobacteria bacterium]|nr:low molecular weight protein-tyrosine-phosphatase [Alphaproteobacteria bacterium]